MLCLPGLTPVANDAHAVGDSAECVVPSGYIPPCSASRFMWGSFPCRIHVAVSVGSMPSKPRITRRCENWLGGRRVRQAEGCVTATPSAIASTAANTATRVDRVRIAWSDYSNGLLADRFKTEGGIRL